MTPEQVEARFQRIEAILIQNAEQNAERDRQWTEQMQERDRRWQEQNAERDRRWTEQIEERDRQWQEQNADRDERIENLEEQMQIMAIGINRLVETSIEYSRWKVETDLRFNNLLEEVRVNNRRITAIENQ